MTPDEHYLEAERLLDQVAAGDRGGTDQDRLIARAHVHAILATRTAAPKPSVKDTSWMDTALPAARRAQGLGHVPTNEVVDYPGDDGRP